MPKAGKMQVLDNRKLEFAVGSGVFLPHPAMKLNATITAISLIIFITPSILGSAFCSLQDLYNLLRLPQTNRHSPNHILDIYYDPYNWEMCVYHILDKEYFR